MLRGRCVAYFCKNDVKMPKALRKDVTFHKFPKEPVLRKHWLKWCRKNGKWNPDYSFVCSLHFTEDDYVRDIEGDLLGCTSRKRLKPGAIPSVNLSLSEENDSESPISREELLNLRGDLDKAKKKIEYHRKLIQKRLNASVGIKPDGTQKKPRIRSERSHIQSSNYNPRPTTENLRKNAILKKFNPQASVIYVSSGSITDCWVPKNIFIPSVFKQTLEKDGNSFKLQNAVIENTAGHESKESSILYELLNSHSNGDRNVLRGKKILWKSRGLQKKPRLILPATANKSCEECSISLNGNSIATKAINTNSHKNQAFIQHETSPSVEILEISNTDEEDNLDMTSDHSYVKTPLEFTSESDLNTSKSSVPPENTTLVLDETEIAYTEVIDGSEQGRPCGISKKKGKVSSLIVKVQSLQAQVSLQKKLIRRLRRRIKEDERLIGEYTQKEDTGELTESGRFVAAENYS